jgi:hypothetical protein
MAAEHNHPPPGNEQVQRFRDEYERLLPEIKQVPSEDLLPINIDIQQAVTTALGAWPEIRNYRAKIVAETPQLDIARFDKYEAYARAVGYAHALYMTAIAPSGNLPPLAQRAVMLRDQILSDANALAKRGLINGERLKELNGPVGYRNVAFDLIALAALIRESWDNIVGKTAIDLKEIDNADDLGSQMVNEVGLREQAPAVVAETAEIRQQAFTLFVNTYDQVRRAINFIRWNEGDVDEIAPSLYAKSSFARKKGGTEVQTKQNGSAASGQPATTTAEARPAAGDTLQSSPVAVGLPGSPALLR